MTITILILGSAVLLLFGVSIIVGTLSRSAETLNEKRLKQLVRRAQIEFPAARLTDSLDKLFEDLYRQIVRVKSRGGKIDQLIQDQMLVANERLRIWRDETLAKEAQVERESSFQHVTREQIERATRSI